MDYRIRRGSIEDIDLLLANRLEFISLISVSNKDRIILSEEFKNTTYNFLKKHLEDDSLVVWLVEEDGKIISIAVVCYYELLPNMSNTTGKIGYIQNVYTLTQYRGRGFASELVNRIKQDAKERQVGKLLLNATDMGRPIYEKLGFEIVENEMVCKLKV